MHWLLSRSEGRIAKARYGKGVGISKGKPMTRNHMMMEARKKPTGWIDIGIGGGNGADKGKGKEEDRAVLRQGNGSGKGKGMPTMARARKRCGTGWYGSRRQTEGAQRETHLNSGSAGVRKEGKEGRGRGRVEDEGEGVDLIGRLVD
jgi:hypothetical protein